MFFPFNISPTANICQQTALLVKKPFYSPSHIKMVVLSNLSTVLLYI